MKDRVRVKSIAVDNISCFENLTINFDPDFNIICGTNGVGKTTILNVIASFFVQGQYIKNIRRRARSEVPGRISIAVLNDGDVQSTDATIDTVDPDPLTQPYGLGGMAPFLIYLTSQRDFPYRVLDGVLRDPERRDGEIQSDALNGISSDNIKQWIANRYLMRPHGQKWPRERLANLELAVRCFSILDERFSLDYVDSSTFEVIVSTPSGSIPFEFLSSGFRASYAILLGIIKEIEFRKLEISADEFSGVILIDELDLHLHPAWQRKMPLVLKEVFPKAQHIVTTHSPHMIQEAKANELIVLDIDSHEPRTTKMVDPEYGFVGWTIEEILQDVMGLDDVRPERFRDALRAYDGAVDKGDTRSVARTRDVLLKMLHPANPLRQILKIESI